MNPIDANRNTQTKMQASTPGENDHVKANQGGSETNQGNGYNQCHTRGGDQKNRGKKQQSIQHQSSNFTGSDESLKVLMLPTKRRDELYLIKFKELVITHVLTNFKYPADIVILINTGSIPVIPLPTFTKTMKEYGFTNTDA